MLLNTHPSFSLDLTPQHLRDAPELTSGNAVRALFAQASKYSIVEERHQSCTVIS